MKRADGLVGSSQVLAMSNSESWVRQVVRYGHYNMGWSAQNVIWMKHAHITSEHSLDLPSAKCCTVSFAWSDGGRKQEREKSLRARLKRDHVID